MKRNYIVEMHGDVRELYLVQASSREEAQENWADGDLVLAEASSMEYYACWVDDGRPESAL